MSQSYAMLVRAVLIAVATASCATSFTGEAHTEGGRAGCEHKCRTEGLEFAGMIYMGEYSDACVCAVPGRTGSSATKLLASASVTAGAAGVMMRMRQRHAGHPR